MADQSILDTTADISKVIAEYERQKAAGNVAQAGVNQNQANTANNLYRTAADVALTGPTASARQAARGDVMANVQPFAWTGGTTMVGNIPVPTSTGGLTPAAFGPNTRQAGAKLGALGNSRVLSPSFNLPAQPSLAPAPQASGLDKTLSVASTLDSVWGAAGKGLGGSGASFPIPWSGFKGFGSGNFPTSDGLPSYDPYSQNPDTGIPNAPQTLPTGDPSGDMAAYYEWLAQQEQDGGADGTYGDNP